MWKRILIFLTLDIVVREAIVKKGPVAATDLSNLSCPTSLCPST